MATIDNKPADRLALTVNANLVPLFFQLLGHGFCVNVHTGCSVKAMLCDQLGIHEDYLAQRIQTIFLNAKVVDDVNSAIVHEDAAMALSGAMPGLVGAILRSSGIYACMRSQITHTNSRPASQLTEGKITLKLWNLVAKELGPTFLQQGVWLKGQTLWEFLESYMDELTAGCLACELDSKPVELNNLREINWSDDMILLQVYSEALDRATQ